ncbi:nucleoside triphosphate pyrophosphatase [Methylobacter sp. BlB1]|uniref:Maf family protein n=1 Tax=Methylobacter sp. BlB1 TaxID=2785914 RepID=UPI001894F022|nr:Maf family nucleotide pyrophosphatase [Methylobacter sp. BlB1]MBF6647688.1 septum formation inhibitor Maf [Methylobacter sp. BlB1]
MKINNLILASSSPYRQALLKKLHLEFKAISPKVDERPLEHEAPEALALRLGKLKAQALCEKYPDHLIIGSDQVAVLNGQQLHKPGGRARAIEQLQAASGNAVIFFTSICIIDSNTMCCLTDLDVCTAYFKTLSCRQIEHYVDLEKPYDCAGSFKSESLGIALFEKIQGDDPNALTGLPLIKLTSLLEKFGVHVL